MHEDGIAPRLIPLGLVVNRYRPRSVEHQYRLAELRDLFDDKVLEPVIEERVGLQQAQGGAVPLHRYQGASGKRLRSEEHTSELQSRGHLVCRLLLEKKKTRRENSATTTRHR